MTAPAEASRVIGYFAIDQGQLLLDGSACIVTGSASTLEALLATQAFTDVLGISIQFRVKKIRFGAIKKGLDGGGAYAFDRAAYDIFYPLASNVGYQLDAEEFAQETSAGLELVTISTRLPVSPTPSQR